MSTEVVSERAVYMCTGNPLPEDIAAAVQVGGPTPQELPHPDHTLLNRRTLNQTPKKNH